MAQTPTETPTPLERREQRHEAHTRSTYAAFLKELSEKGGMAPDLAGCAAAAVVNALLQRIQPSEAKDLEAQLPRRLVEFLPRPELWRAGPSPLGKSKEDFLRAVAEDLGMEVSRVEPVVRAVLNTLREHISEGEAEDVERNLRPDLRELWRRPQ
ncbi:MAG TPA: DUF2267 domain-containing protein [Myxococcaceae bacterium]|nr:DUF2267 domain-containing protein [Myxococcaceae bacterium]